MLVTGAREFVPRDDGIVEGEVEFISRTTESMSSSAGDVAVSTEGGSEDDPKVRPSVMK